MSSSSGLSHLGWPWIDYWMATLKYLEWWQLRQYVICTVAFQDSAFVIVVHTTLLKASYLTKFLASMGDNYSRV